MRLLRRSSTTRRSGLGVGSCFDVGVLFYIADFFVLAGLGGGHGGRPAATQGEGGLIRRM